MANNNEGISTKVGVQGDKEYKSALQQISRQLTVLNTDMKASQSAFGSQTETMAGLQDRMEKLGEIYEAQSKKVELIREQLEKAKAEYGENSAQADQLQIALNRATAQMNGTATQIEATKSGMQTLAEAQRLAGDETDTTNMTLKEAEQALKDAGGGAEEMADAAADAGDAAGEMGSASEDAAEGTSSFRDALSDAAEIAGGAFVVGVEAVLGAMAAVGTATAAAMKEAFGLAQDAGKYADDLMTLSTQIGVDTDRLQQWEYASNFIDTSVDTITGSLSKLTKNMADAQDGSESAQEKFTKLGVSWRDFDGNLRDSEDVFMDAIDALGAIENPTERDAMAMELFGKSAKELNPLIEAGSRAWREMGQEADAMGTVFSRENLEKMGSFDDAMQRFKATGTALKNSIGLVMIPAFQPLVNAASSSMGKVAKALQEGVDPAELEGLLDEVINGLMDALDDVLDTVERNLPMVTRLVGRLVTHVAEALPGLTQALLPEAMGLLQSVLDGITGNIGPIAQLATTLVTELAGFLAENVPELLEAGATLLDGLVEGVIAALPELIPAAIEMIVKLAEGLITGLPRLVEKLPEIVTAIWNGLKATDWAGLGGEVLDSILAGLGTIGKDIMDLLGVPEDMQETITTAWQTFAGAIGDAVKGAFSAVTAFLGGLFDPPTEDDQAATSGLWGTFADLVGTSITGILKSVVDFFGALFDPPAEGDQTTTSQQWGTFAQTLASTVKTALVGTAELVSGIFTGGKAAIEEFPWEDVGKKLGTLAGKFTGFAADALGGIFDAGTAAITAFPWDDVGKKLGTLAGQFAGMAADTLSGIFDAGSAAIAEFPWEDTGKKMGVLAGQVTGIAQDALSGVFTAADTAITGIDWTGLGEKVGVLVDGVVGIPADALSGIFTATETAITGIKWDELGSQIADGLSRAWGILAGVGDVALGLGESVVGAGQQGVGALKDWIASWRQDGSVQNEATAVGAQVVTDVATGVTDTTPDLETTAQTAATALLDAIKGVLTQTALWGVGNQLVTDLGSGITDTEGDVLLIAETLAGDVFDDLVGEVDRQGFGMIGMMMDAGIARGVMANSWMIQMAAMNAALEAYNAAKAALGIQSPSKKGAWLGEMFDAGFAEGIEDNADQVEAAVGYLNDLAAADAANVEARISGGTRQQPFLEMDYGAVKDAFVEAIEQTGVGEMMMVMDGRVLGETLEPYNSRASWQRQQRSVKGRAARMLM